MRTLPRLGFIFMIAFLLLAGKGNRGAAAALQNANNLVVPTSTAIPILPLVTSTPDANGTVVHVVQYGQALISIASAYGISLKDLKALNNLQTDSITAGEKLIIRIGATPTITTTVTRTATTTVKPTSTPRSRTPTAPPSTPTAARTRTATPRPPLIDLGSDRQTLGVGIIVVCALGLVVVGITSFRKN